MNATTIYREFTCSCLVAIFKQAYAKYGVITAAASMPYNTLTGDGMQLEAAQPADRAMDLGW